MKSYNESVGAVKCWMGYFTPLKTMNAVTYSWQLITVDKMSSCLCFQLAHKPACRLCIWMTIKFKPVILWYHAYDNNSLAPLLYQIEAETNCRHSPDDILNRNARISLKISLKFVPKVRINNIPALVQIMAWRRPGAKPLAEPMMVSLLTRIGVNRPQSIISTCREKHFSIFTQKFLIKRCHIDLLGPQKLYWQALLSSSCSREVLHRYTIIPYYQYASHPTASWSTMLGNWQVIFICNAG